MNGSNAMKTCHYNNDRFATEDEIIPEGVNLSAPKPADFISIAQTAIEGMNRDHDLGDFQRGYVRAFEHAIAIQQLLQSGECSYRVMTPKPD